MQGTRELDRRWVFLLLALAMAGSMVWPYRQPIKPNEQVVKVYDKIEAIKPGGAVLMSLDFDPQAKAELQPMAKAILRHCFRRNLRVVGMTFWTVGADMAERIMNEVAAEEGKVYGKDYAFLGIQPGGMAMVITGIGENLKRRFPQDVRGLKTDNLAVLKGIDRLSDFGCIVELAAGETVGAWVVYGADKYKVPMAVGCTAVSGPDNYVFIDTGQILGMIAGLRGAADYESLIQQPDAAAAGMAAQTSVHVLIILLILVGNISFFISRRRGSRAAPPAGTAPDSERRSSVDRAVLIGFLVVFALVNVALFAAGRGVVLEYGLPSLRLTAGRLVAVFVTFAMFSFLYRDNPMFRMVENVFVGVGLGIGTVITWYMYFKPLIYDRLIEPAFSPVDRVEPQDWWLLVPIALGCLLLARVSRSAGWVSRYTVALMIGYGAGFSIEPSIQSIILRQSSRTIEIAPISWPIGLFFAAVLGVFILGARTAARGGLQARLVTVLMVLVALAYAGLKFLPFFSEWTEGVDSILVIIGVVTVMAYFFFSAEHKGLLGASGRLGIIFLMISFGASFGYTVMARESLLIGRFQFLLGDWLGLLP